jgi:hypothetical protein
MKIRVTLMTENDKHLDESVSKEMVEEKTKLVWETLMRMLHDYSEDENEVVTVEKCELVER